MNGARKNRVCGERSEASVVPAWKRASGSICLLTTLLCQERDGDGEFRGEEEGEVNEPGGGEGGVSGWPGAEAVVEDFVVWLCADQVGDEGGVVWCAWEAGQDVFGKVRHVRLAAGEHVWAWLSDQVLKTTTAFISTNRPKEDERGTYEVINHVPAQLIPSPSHPVNHSQSFLFQIKLFGTDFGTVGPGTSNRQITTMIAAGTKTETMMRTAPLTVSSPYGKLISWLPREKWRLLGEMVASHVPIPAAALG